MKPILRFIYRSAARVLGGSNIERFAPVARLNEFVTSHLKASIVHLDGMTFHLDAQDSMTLSILRAYEPAASALMRQQIRPGDTVVDVGANIGYFTVLMSKLVGEGGAVHAFEPAPENFALLQRNLAENHCKNVRAECKAVGAKSGGAQLYMSTKDNLDHRLYDSGDNRQCVAADMVSLDDYFPDHETGVDFIKIDVQGAEPAVLEGMSALCARCESLKLLTEFWPSGIGRYGGDAKAYLHDLRAAGFSLQDCGGAALNAAPLDTVRLLSRHTPENERFTNLFCRRNNA